VRSVGSATQAGRSRQVMKKARLQGRPGLTGS
jgi:hypothetical protein